MAKERSRRAKEDDAERTDTSQGELLSSREIMSPTPRDPAVPQTFSAHIMASAPPTETLMETESVDQEDGSSRSATSDLEEKRAEVEERRGELSATIEARP